MIALSIKQGATFELCCVLHAADGAPVSLIGCTIQSQLRDSLGGLIADLICEIASVSSAINLTTSGGTDRWPVGQHLCDVMIQNEVGVIVVTQTFTVFVLPSVTQFSQGMPT